MTYEFIKEINTVTADIVNKLYEGDIGILLIRNCDSSIVEEFGELLPQDLYNNKVIPVGIKDKEQDHVWHTTEMLWHQDRAYNKLVHPFVGLYCVVAESGSSPTHFLDMQRAYAESSDGLKKDCENVVCVNEVAKYFKQAEYPHTFRNKTWERAYRMKARAEHSLVQSDKYGNYYFYSPAYTLTDFEDRLKEECIKSEYIVTHWWQPQDLLVYNNLKILHKREETPEHVDRRHLRFAIDKHKSF